MIDPAKTSVVIVAHPDLRVAPDLLLWILDHGFPRKNVLVVRGEDRDNVCAYNHAVELALTRKTEWHLFADADVRPYAGTDAMLAAPYELTCAMTDTERGLESWARPDSFHAGMWLAKSAALRRIPAPWFAWGYNATGTKLDACMCATFRDNAKAAGLTIGHAGHARHWPRGAKLPDAILLPKSAQYDSQRKALSAKKDSQQ